MVLAFRRLYFDWVYAPAYDLTVARLAPYRRFQESCLERLSLRGGYSVLSVGVGTGNELPLLLNRDASMRLSVSGVDLSPMSLMRAGRKVPSGGLSNGSVVELTCMDAQHLDFPSEQFDRVLCVHTMDFVQDVLAATHEIVRVLKRGGEFVVTYPSGRGGPGLVGEIGRSVSRKLRTGKLLAALGETVSAIGAGLVYAPLAWSPGSHLPFPTRPALEQMLTSVGISKFTVEEDPSYQDYIVWAVK